MNRSVDSLDVIYEESSGSSSPTDFTSDDDETNTDNLIFMSGQQPNKIPAYGRKSLTQSVDFNSDQENRLHVNLNLQSWDLDRSNVFSFPSVHNMRSMNNSLPDDRSSAQDEDINSSMSARHLIARNRISQAHRSGHSSNAIDHDNIIMPNVGMRTDFFEHHDEPVPPTSGSSMGVNLAVRFCSELVEIGSLLDAMEFVEQNRDLIDSLTRIVRDAPAYRNYDLNNYRIDYLVKESFNPNFWLDREPVVTTADGNCQYHAVSISLTGSEAYTPEVRLAAAVAVIDNHSWFDATLKLIDKGTVLDLVHTIARSYSWGDETTLKAIAVAIKRRIFLYTCNIGKKDYEMVRSLSKEELLDAFKEKKYRGGTGIHTYADPLTHVSANNYIMLFHKSDHFIAVLPTGQQLTMYEPYNPIIPVFS